MADSASIRASESRKPITTGSCWPSLTRCGWRMRRSATGSGSYWPRDAHSEAESPSKRAELQRQETLPVQQQNRLLNVRLAEDIDGETIACKHTECGNSQCASLRPGTFRTRHSNHLPRATSGLVY